MWSFILLKKTIVVILLCLSKIFPGFYLNLSEVFGGYGAWVSLNTSSFSHHNEALSLKRHNIKNHLCWLASVCIGTHEDLDTDMIFVTVPLYITTVDFQQDLMEMQTLRFN